MISMTTITKLNSQNRFQTFANYDYATNQSSKPAIFLDRDGVVIEDCHYLKDPRNVVLCEGVIRLFRLSKERNIPIVIVTNQSGIFRGLLTWDDYQAVNEKMVQSLEDPTNLLAIYANSCSPNAKFQSWRKPSPEMLKDAAKRFNLDLRNSVMIGDRLTDIEAGLNAGIENLVHVLTGHGDADKQKFLTLAKGVREDSSQNFYQLKNLLDFNFDLLATQEHK